MFETQCESQNHIKHLRYGCGGIDHLNAPCFKVNRFLKDDELFSLGDLIQVHLDLFQVL